MRVCLHPSSRKLIWLAVQTIVALPLRKARKLGLKTPTLETIVALVSAVDWRFRNGIGAPF